MDGFFSSALKCVGFSNGQPRIHQDNQIHGFGCPAFEIGTTWIFFLISSTVYPKEGGGRSQNAKILNGKSEAKLENSRGEGDSNKYLPIKSMGEVWILS